MLACNTLHLSTGKSMTKNQLRQNRRIRKRDSASPARNLSVEQQTLHPADRQPLLSPTRVREALRQASILQRTDRLPEARALYLRVLTAQPRHRAALKSCAVVLFQLDEIREAVGLLRRAIALDGTDAGAHNDLGNILQAAGHADEAIASYLRAIALAPETPEFCLNLGNSQRESGDFDAALRNYERALQLRPDYAKAAFQRGLALHALDRLDEAAKIFSGLTRNDPRFADAHLALGNVLYALGQLDEARNAFETTAKLKPAMLDALFEVGKPRHVHLHFDRGDPGAALAACDAFLARRPGHSCAVSLKALALRDLGNPEVARALIGLDRFFWQHRLETPDGFADLTAFNEALARHVQAHPTLVDARESYSMFGGKNTGEMLTEATGPIAAFEQMIDRAVEAYRDALPADSNHPFVANRPERWQLSAWGVVLNAGDNQVPHIHPSAWLSGVYYVRLPKVVAAPDGEAAGWIEFGKPYWDFEIRAELEVKLVQPKEGLVLLFPSYVFHRTLPFEGEEDRISIAFDILRDD